MGVYWAGYYREVLKAKGVTDFSVKVVRRGKAAGSPLTAAQARLSLYRQAGAGLFQLEPVKDHSIWVTALPNVRGWTVDKVGEVFPVQILDELLRYSLTMLDDSLSRVHAVVGQSYEYPLLDFLYFSAVTITTLGYGDILPNSPLVRSLVMTEALVGLVIVGVFVSSLLWKEQ